MLYLAALDRILHGSVIVVSDLVGALAAVDYVHVAVEGTNDEIVAVPTVDAVRAAGEIIVEARVDAVLAPAAVELVVALFTIYLVDA